MALAALIIPLIIIFAVNKNKGTQSITTTETTTLTSKQLITTGMTTINATTTATATVSITTSIVVLTSTIATTGVPTTDSTDSTTTTNIIISTTDSTTITTDSSTVITDSTATTTTDTTTTTTDTTTTTTDTTTTTTTSTTTTTDTTTTTTDTTTTTTDTTTTTAATTTTTTTTDTTTTTTDTTTTTTDTTTTTSTISTTTTTTALNTGWNTTGIIVAGTGVAGASATNLNYPVALAMDLSKSLYIVDRLNNRIQKWTYGASSGTTVAGSSSGTAGTALNFLSNPSDVEVDSSGNIYVADSFNNRIVLWTVNASSGTVVAGNGTQGYANNQLNKPFGIVHDWTSGILYIADTSNDRIMSYAPGASTGTLCIGGTGLGTTQLKYPTGLYFDSSSNSLYIANSNAYNVVRWVVGASNWILVAGSSNGTAGISSILLNYPRDVFLDSMKNVYVADTNNSRIQFFPAGQCNGSTIAGSSVGIAGSSSNLLYGPIGLLVDSDFDLYVAEYLNQRATRFDHY